MLEVLSSFLCVCFYLYHFSTLIDENLTSNFVHWVILSCCKPLAFYLVSKPLQFFCSVVPSRCFCQFLASSSDYLVGYCFYSFLYVFPHSTFAVLIVACTLLSISDLCIFVRCLYLPVFSWFRVLDWIPHLNLVFMMITLSMSLELSAVNICFQMTLMSNWACIAFEHVSLLSMYRFWACITFEHVALLLICSVEYVGHNCVNKLVVKNNLEICFST